MNKCVVCGFVMKRTEYRRNALYCSDTCRRKRESVINPTSTGKVGGAGELLVCADLIYQGYEVFRAVTQAASCDLIRLKDGVLERVEVRSGRRNTEGRLYYAKVYSTKCDVIAVVTPEREIVYVHPTHVVA